MRIHLDPPTGENHKHDDLFADTATVEVRSGDKATVAAPEYDRSKLADADGGETSYRKSLEPHGSMEFESKEDAFNFYKEYASSVGFSAIIKASRRSRISGKFIDAKFVCTRYGSKPGTSFYDNSQPADSTASRVPVKKKRGRTNRSSSKTDCKACMHVKRRQDGRWTISSFVSEHNHELVLDQAGRTSLDICHHNVYALNAVQAKKKKTFMSMSQQSGRMQKVEGHATACSSFCGLRLGFRDGDAQVMFEYFSCMQDENPYFFYAMDLDREQHLKNVFWVDAKGRIDYQIFGDVVLFDTMYKKNEFKLPFVPFIGVNNHFQFLLFGSALVADESKSTYVWLMRAWIRSMHGQAPKVILTDQDPALKEAIAEVLPGSRHCFCLWHILSKIQEKLGYDKYEDEAKADFDTWHRQPGLKSPSPYGKQLAKIYTHAVFKNSKLRHVMIILQISGVNNIPAKYILKRWMKDAKKREAVKQVDATVSRNQRYNDLCQFACELGPSFSSNDRFHEFEEVTRGKFIGKTIKEGIISGKERGGNMHRVHCWDQMGYLNFRPSAVDCSYVSQESVRRMGQLNLRVPTIGGISGNPDIVPVDQLNRIAPNRDDCFSNQANIEDLVVQL
ncbi:UNVERIFIED_CONTAM: protein FAR-RED IMPAIRED RESPONSE 1 [Sesamum latifolium]|uniref:Protein FAR1-RELATED SEQUENCE n=1 Tax=Sesamum latifolium TaxID=2727402 RepID=A0AAW2WL29_9LAMI